VDGPFSRLLRINFHRLAFAANLKEEAEAESAFITAQLITKRNSPKHDYQEGTGTAQKLAARLTGFGPSARLNFRAGIFPPRVCCTICQPFAGLTRFQEAT
jgi:hypothetical protein